MKGKKVTGAGRDGREKRGRNKDGGTLNREKKPKGWKRLSIADEIREERQRKLET